MKKKGLTKENWIKVVQKDLNKDSLMPHEVLNRSIADDVEAWGLIGSMLSR